MFFCAFLFISSLLPVAIFCDEDYSDIPFRFKNRDMRKCKFQPMGEGEPFYRKSVFESAVYLFFIILLGILFILLFFGVIKGLLGIFVNRKVGEWGLHLLIDLPKPLDEYQEPLLKGRVVCYDVVGWPVHPDTGERTVRTLPLKTEFCLNLIFFLAYPLALCMQLCSICCCIREYKGEADEQFKEVNVIKVNNSGFCRKSKDKKPSGPKMDTYKENDTRESRDTNYVVNIMRQSQMSIERFK